MIRNQHGGGSKFLLLALFALGIGPSLSHAQCPLLGESAKGRQPSTSSPQFFDEPTFTVAGVTDTTNQGGHASANAVPPQALSKEVASLKQASPDRRLAADEQQLRAAVEQHPADFDANYQLGRFLANTQRRSEAIPYLERALQIKPDDSQLHHLLADVEEKSGNSLAAERQYERAAELQPNEANLFDWGAELFAHGAIDPAIQVFSKGNRLFPRSERMLVGLGAAALARGSYDQAGRSLCAAVDLDPHNPSTYAFFDQLQTADSAQSEAVTQRLARYQALQPDNALANYYYALSAWNRRSGQADAATLAKVESLLRIAVRLDPKLAPAHLQLGILYAEQKNFPDAMAALERAIQINPRLDTAHFRLAQMYRASGQKAKADRETEIYKQLASEAAANSPDRRTIQQFVYTLRQPDSTHSK